MKICIQDADSAYAKTFLIATDVGAGLYRKLGFMEVDSMTFDTEAYGYHENTTWLCMVRESSTGSKGELPSTMVSATKNM